MRLRGAGRGSATWMSRGARGGAHRRALALLAASTSEEARRVAVTNEACPSALQIRLLAGRSRTAKSGGRWDPHTPAASWESFHVRSGIAGGRGWGRRVRASTAALLARCCSGPAAELAASAPAVPPLLREHLALCGDANVRAGIAANPRCSRDDLMLLGEDEGDVGRAVLANPSCPLDALVAVGAFVEALPDTDREMGVGSSMVAAAASNQSFPAETVRRFADHDDWAFRAAAAASPQCPGDLLAVLADDEDETVSENALSNPNCPTDKLVAAAEDPYADVRTCAALNPRCPSESLSSLVRYDNTALVREALASNPACSAEDLALLAQDLDDVVRVGIAWNPACSVDTLDGIASDDDPNVREAAIAAIAARGGR